MPILAPFGFLSGGSAPFSGVIDPLDFTFSLTSTTPIIRPIVDAFTTNDIDATDGGVAADFNGSQIGSSVAANGTGVITVTGSGGSNATLRTTDEPSVPFWTCQIAVESLAASSPVVGCGIWKDASNIILGYWDNGNFGIYVISSGSTYASGNIAAYALTAPFELAVVMTENVVSVLYDEGSGWVEGCSINLTSLRDFTIASRLVGMKYCAYFSGNGVTTFSRWRSGLSGEFGRSSFYPIHYEDGTIMRSGDYIYLSCTFAGLDESSLYRSNGLGVARWDTSTNEVEMVSRILFDRDSHIRADAYGPIVKDRTSSLWRLFPQNTGTFVNVAGERTLQYTVSTGTNILSGFHLLSGDVEVPLPSGVGLPRYDLDVRKLGSTVYWAFVEVDGSTWRGVLATSSDFDGTGFARVGDDDSPGGVMEGPRIMTLGVDDFVALGNGTSFRFYDLSMSYLGAITDAAFTSGSGAPMHPSIVPVHSGGNTYFKMLTFNTDPPFAGMGKSYGDQLLFTAAEFLAGLQP